MKILVISNDEREQIVIGQVLQQNSHQMILAGNSDEAMQQLQEDGIRFVIADRNSTDIDDKQFIKRVRDAQPPYYIYILLIASKISENDVTTPHSGNGADDYLHKPATPLALKTRLQLGERMLTLGDGLLNAKSALEKTAIFDPITKTLNETAFISISRGELERARRGQTPISLVALDIKNFASIKANHGDEIAQEALILLADVIREKSRMYDGVGRLGERMFLIPLPGVIGQDAEKITNRILNGIKGLELALADGTDLHVQVGAGLIFIQRVTVSTEVETLISQAREAALRAEHEGENQIQAIFS